MLGDVNKLFVFKSLLTMPSNVLPLHLKQTFPPKIWIFTEGEGNGIKFRLPFKIFSTLRNVWVTTLLLCFWKNLLISSKKMASMLLVCLHAITCLIIPLSTTQAGDCSILKMDWILYWPASIWIKFLEKKNWTCCLM